jgi:hypothetical protein
VPGPRFFHSEAVYKANMPSTILNSIVMPNDQAEVDMHGATSSPVIVKAPVVGSDGKPITKANLADYPLPGTSRSY